MLIFTSIVAIQIFLNCQKQDYISPNLFFSSITSPNYRSLIVSVTVWDKLLFTGFTTDVARKFDSFIVQKNLTGLIKPDFFMSIYLFYFIVLYSILSKV